MLPTRKRRISNDYSARVHPVMRGTHYRTRQHMNQFTHKQQWRWQNVFRASPSIERIGASQASEATVTQTPLSTRVTIPLDASTVEVLVETVAVTKNTNNANMTNMVDADPAPVTAPVLAAKLMGKRWSDGDIQTNPEPFLESTSAKNLRPRSVSFLPTVEVTLIPCRREYKEAQVCKICNKYVINM
ncbi:hypothetical protein B484DRAFT_16650 [Ochromonadaceae sp. CCMP2298]|nr:hypothetical protein B484DRAFT_16650 [Ochromonadaceae sp. CCMP2298]